MSTTYSDLFNYVLPDLPMAPPELVKNAIRDAVIDLCERANIYRQELQQILVLGPVSTETTATSAQGATSLTVDDITDFSDLDTITVDLSDGTKWRGHVSGAPVGSTITLDGALNLDVEIGATVTKLTYLYPITLPTGTAFVKILKAYLNDSPLDPISEDDIDSEFNNTDFNWVGANWRTDVNLPTRVYMADDSTVGLIMPPAACGEGNLRILAALKPTRASTTFPTIIYERHVETIAHGAKYRIMQIPKKPYSDKQMAQYHEGMFNALVGEAMITAARSATRAPLRTHTVFGLR